MHSLSASLPAGSASPVDKHGGRVGSGGLQVGHGVPLVDAALLRVDAARVEGHPGEGDAPGEVVEPARHLTCLVEDLQRRPAVAKHRFCSCYFVFSQFIYPDYSVLNSRLQGRYFTAAWAAHAAQESHTQLTDILYIIEKNMN